MSNRLRALCIAYLFPHASGPQRRDMIVGGERMRQFAARLPAHGIDTRVITHHAGATAEVAPGLTAARDFFRTVIAGTWADMGRSQAREVESSGLRRQIPRFTFPDRPTYTWAPLAVRAALQLARRERFDLVVSTSPPMASHVVAAAVARRLGIPWIADVRDGYAFEPPEGDVSNVAARIALERMLLGRADRIVSVTEPLSEHFRAIMPSRSDRVFTVLNGYDDEAVAAAVRLAPPAVAPPPLRVLYAGSTSMSVPHRRLESLIGAYQQLQHASPRGFACELLGHFSDADRSAATAAGMEVLGWVQREEALSRMARAHVLLVLSGNNRHVATTKLFEYLGLGRPVLVIGRRSAAARIVEEHGFGTAADDTPEAIRQALQAFSDAWPEWELRMRNEALARARLGFSRSTQAAEFAELCRAVVAS